MAGSKAKMEAISHACTLYLDCRELPHSLQITGMILVLITRSQSNQFWECVFRVCGIGMELTAKSIGKGQLFNFMDGLLHRSMTRLVAIFTKANPCNLKARRVTFNPSLCR